MRIISQNGLIDVPYKKISIEIRENEIWCGCIATLGKTCVAKRFAGYSTQEKAEKAMQLLHNCYQGTLPHTIFRFPQEHEI